MFPKQGNPPTKSDDEVRMMRSSMIAITNLATTITPSRLGCPHELDRSQPYGSDHFRVVLTPISRDRTRRAVSVRACEHSIPLLLTSLSLQPMSQDAVNRCLRSKARPLYLSCVQIELARMNIHII